MAFYDPIEKLAGKKVRNFEPEKPLARFVSSPGADRVPAILLSPLDAQASIDALTLAAERLPSLRALYIADGEDEISWIEPSNVAELLEAFPNLAHLQVRGASDPTLGNVEQLALERLIVESVEISADFLKQIAELRWPKLKHLELWLGAAQFVETKKEDLEPLLRSDKFPVLETLGLCNSEFTDVAVEALAGSPMLQRIQTLDLSGGTLSNPGAERLLAACAGTRLERIKLHHHFVSNKLISELRECVPELDEADAMAGPEGSDGGPDDDRFCETGE